MTELLAVPEEKVSPPLSLKELCLVEPLTLGMRAIARARVTAGDVVAVYGCDAVASAPWSTRIPRRAHHRY